MLANLYSISNKLSEKLAAIFKFIFLRFAFESCGGIFNIITNHTLTRYPQSISAYTFFQVICIWRKILHHQHYHGMFFFLIRSIKSRHASRDEKKERVKNRGDGDKLLLLQCRVSERERERWKILDSIWDKSISFKFNGMKCK